MTEHLVHRFGFRLVVLRGGRAMGVDVHYIGGSYTGVF